MPRAAMAIRPTISQLSPNVSNCRLLQLVDRSECPVSVNPCRFIACPCGCPSGHTFGTDATTAILA